MISELKWYETSKLIGTTSPSIVKLMCGQCGSWDTARDLLPQFISETSELVNSYIADLKEARTSLEEETHDLIVGIEGFKEQLRARMIELEAIFSSFSSHLEENNYDEEASIQVVTNLNELREFFFDPLYTNQINLFDREKEREGQYPEWYYFFLSIATMITALNDVKNRADDLEENSANTLCFIPFANEVVSDTYATAILIALSWVMIFFHKLPKYVRCIEASRDSKQNVSKCWRMGE